METRPPSPRSPTGLSTRAVPRRAAAGGENSRPMWPSIGAGYTGLTSAYFPEGSRNPACGIALLEADVVRPPGRAGATAASR